MLDFALTKEGKQYVAVIIIMAAQNCGAPGLIDTAQLWLDHLLYSGEWQPCGAHFDSLIHTDSQS